MHDGIILILGKRGSGKSTMLDDFLYSRRNCPVVMVMSETEQSNHFFSQRIPKACIYNTFDTEAIQRLIKHQKKITDKYKKCPMTEAVLILDDCASNSKLRNDKGLRELFLNGRHFNICVVLTSQIYKVVPPDLRGNVDYVFVFHTKFVKDCQTLHTEFFGMFSHWKVFKAVFDSATKDRHCMVLHNSSMDDGLDKTLFVYKAQLRTHQTFRVGCRKLWERSNQRIQEQKQLLHTQGKESSQPTGIEKLEKEISTARPQDLNLSVVRIPKTTPGTKTPQPPNHWFRSQVPNSYSHINGYQQHPKSCTSISYALQPNPSISSPGLQPQVKSWVGNQIPNTLQPNTNTYFTSPHSSVFTTQNRYPGTWPTVTSRYDV